MSVLRQSDEARRHRRLVREHRRRLKARLWDERNVSETGGPVCPVCGVVLGDRCEMHEVFVRRILPLARQAELRELLFAPENCVLVHPVCHGLAELEEGRRSCERHLVAAVGRDQIEEWLSKLSAELKVPLPALALP